MANNTNGLVGFWIRGAYEAIRSWRRGFIRNSGAGELIELFLVASICSVLETWPETGFSRVVSYTWGIKK